MRNFFSCTGLHALRSDLFLSTNIQWEAISITKKTKQTKKQHNNKTKQSSKMGCIHFHFDGLFCAFILYYCNSPIQIAYFNFRSIQPKIINLDIHFSEHTTSLNNKPHHKVIGMRLRRL